MNQWWTPAADIWWVVLIKCAVLLLVVITTFAYAMLAERKVMGWMQMRPVPTAWARGVYCSPPSTR